MKGFIPHHTVNHSKKQCVNGVIHTKTQLRAFRQLLKEEWWGNFIELVKNI